MGLFHTKPAVAVLYYTNVVHHIIQSINDIDETGVLVESINRNHPEIQCFNLRSNTVGYVKTSGQAFLYIHKISLRNRERAEDSRNTFVVAKMYLASIRWAVRSVRSHVVLYSIVLRIMKTKEIERMSILYRYSPKLRRESSKISRDM